MTVKTVTVNGRTYEILGFYREEQFRQVEINGEVWEIPEDWRVAAGYDIFEVVDKNTRKITIQPGKKYKLVTVKLYGKGIQLRSTAIGGKDIKAKHMFEVQTGDFIFSKIDARNGAYGFVPPALNNAVVTSDFPILSLKSGTYQRYIDIAVKRPVVWETIRTRAAGSTNRRRIRANDFLDAIRIPLPPLQEQIAIAAVLSDIDDAIQKAEEAIKAAEELKKSMMHHLFTHGTRGAPRKQVEINGEVWEIPEDWEVVKLGEIVQHSRNGGTPPTKITRYWNGSIPWITSTALENFTVTDSDVGRYVTESAIKEGKTAAVDKDDLLMAVRVGIGRVAVAGKRIAYNQDVIGLKVDRSRVLTKFLVHLFRSQKYKILLKSGVRSTTIPGIRKEFLMNVPIPLPPLPEQKEIAGILSAIDRMIEKQKERKKSLEELKKSVMHELLTGKVRAIVR